MEMKIKYYIEQKHYPIEEVIALLGKKCIEELLKKRICEELPQSQKIVFEFVGIAIYQQKVICVLPKYIKDISDENTNLGIIKLLIKVLRKYGNSNKQYEGYDYLSSKIDEHISGLAIADFVLNDYSLNGYYKKTREDTQLNGNGEIIWYKTIEELTPYFVKGQPYYLDTFNNDNSVDQSNIILQIHKWAVYTSYQYFGEILDYSKIQVDDSITDINVLGPTEYLITVLDKELALTFVDQQIMLLKALKLIISNQTFGSDNKLTLFGTKSFEKVWEKVCSFILNNQYEFFEKDIPRPAWTIFPETRPIYKQTYIPDIIRTTSATLGNLFFILDAKYYDIKYDQNGLKNNPGISDVSKQLLYDKALEKASNSYSKKFNIFLFPSDSTSIFEYFGTVNLDFLELDPINLVYVSAKVAFNMYLKNEIIDDMTLHTFAQEIEAKRHSYSI